MARQPRGRLVQRLLTPRRHLVPQRFFCQVHLLVRIALLGQLERHEPVHVRVGEVEDQLALLALGTPFPGLNPGPFPGSRSEEHTSELQSHVNLVCRLLLEKKKNSTRSLGRHTQKYRITE